MFIEPVARFHSPLKSKFGIPRQSGLVAGLKGRIVFEPSFRVADSVRGLEGFDYIWLIWGFSGNRPRSSETFQATVRPPRLGGNERIGVFASRSPFRPNGLGLSSVRIESIEYSGTDSDGRPTGPVVNVLGADLMDGTPIYDIKPYVTYADCHPEAASGFVGRRGWEPLEVVLSIPEASNASGSAGQNGCSHSSLTAAAPGWTEADLDTLREILAQDPRPRYQNDPKKVYGMTYKDRDIHFTVEDGVLTVTGIKPLSGGKR